MRPSHSVRVQLVDGAVRKPFLGVLNARRGGKKEEGPSQVQVQALLRSPSRFQLGGRVARFARSQTPSFFFLLCHGATTPSRYSPRSSSLSPSLSLASALPTSQLPSHTRLSLSQPRLPLRLRFPTTSLQQRSAQPLHKPSTLHWTAPLRMERQQRVTRSRQRRRHSS